MSSGMNRLLDLRILKIKQTPLPDGHRYWGTLIAYGVVSILAAVTVSRYKPPTLVWAKYLFVFSRSGLAARR
jgi:hypothetical protein